MRLLQFVIVTIVIAYPDVVLSSKMKKRTKGAKDENGPCGKKYLRQVNGKCYYFPGKQLNWYGAENNCLRKGLHLADLATEEDFNAVIGVLRTRGNMEDYWFGGNDLQTEGRFTYISTGRTVRYYGGLPSIEPTHRANLDDCLEIRLRENGTTVTDDNCLEKQYFVCQLNDLKCAQPVEDTTGNEHHSHEHLHHFHHDAGAEDRKNDTLIEEEESDSRPEDVSDAEGGDNAEETTNASPSTGEGEEGTGEPVSVTPGPEGEEGSPGTGEGGEASEGESPGDEANTPAGAEDATPEEATPGEGGEETPATEAAEGGGGDEGEATPAPAEETPEGGAAEEVATEAPPEGETPEAAPAEGEAAAEDALQARAPKAVIDPKDIRKQPTKSNNPGINVSTPPVLGADAAQAITPNPFA